MTSKSYAPALCLFLSIAAAGVAAAEGLPRNWPMAPRELERRFAEETFTIKEVKSAGGGVTGASRLLIAFPDGATMKIKWKPVADKSADGWNNSPRKELAAYELQRWLVDEDDFIVPTTVAYCIPLEDYKAINADPKPTFPGSNCVLGMIAVWVTDVDAPEQFWDPERFAGDPQYARFMADFNVLTYLIEHRDGRRGNLLVSTIPGDPRVYAVDNGISFDPFPWNFLVKNWHKIRVPWLRRETIERLRRVGRKELDQLGVVAEMAVDKNRVFRIVPPGPNMKPSEGARVTRDRVQFGLERDEIEDVKERLEDLLEDVDDGKIQVR